MTADDILTDNGFVVLGENENWRYYSYDPSNKLWICRTKIGTHTAEFFKSCYIEKNKITLDNYTLYWLVTPFDFCGFAHDVKEFVKEYKNNKQQLNIKNINKDFE